jgi:hypothetical protein
MLQHDADLVRLPLPALLHHLDLQRRRGKGVCLSVQAAADNITCTLSCSASRIKSRKRQLTSSRPLQGQLLVSTLPPLAAGSVRVRAAGSALPSD